MSPEELIRSLAEMLDWMGWTPGGVVVPRPPLRLDVIPMPELLTALAKHASGLERDIPEQLLYAGRYLLLDGTVRSVLTFPKERDGVRAREWCELDRTAWQDPEPEWLRLAKDSGMSPIKAALLRQGTEAHKREWEARWRDEEQLWVFSRLFARDTKGRSVYRGTVYVEREDVNALTPKKIEGVMRDRRRKEWRDEAKTWAKDQARQGLPIDYEGLRECLLAWGCGPGKDDSLICPDGDTIVKKTLQNTASELNSRLSR